MYFCDCTFVNYSLVLFQLTSNDEICVTCYLRAQRVVASSHRSSPLLTHPISSQRIEQFIDVEGVVPSTSRGSLQETSAEQPISSENIEDADIEEIGPSTTEGPLQQTSADQPMSSQHIEVVDVGPSTSRGSRVPSQETSAEQIRLPTLRRAADTARRCLFLECNDSEKRRVPDGLRKHVIKDFNFFIPRNARICDFHFGSNLFHELYAAENAMSIFSAAHIEEIVFLLADDDTLDFQNPDNMDDHLFKYWFGRTKVEFNDILIEIPRLNSPKVKIGFCAFLCKMRTADSDERISALFQIPRRTLEGYINQAREILCQDYVPRHLGWEHKPRDDFVARNSFLAENLFGNPEAPIEQRHLIAIADGTYLYTQKSSNYLFQKETYSLHKYHNLVKPFLIVCCDGKGRKENTSDGLLLGLRTGNTVCDFHDNGTSPVKNTELTSK